MILTIEGKDSAEFVAKFKDAAKLFGITVGEVATPDVVSSVNAAVAEVTASKTRAPRKAKVADVVAAAPTLTVSEPTVVEGVGGRGVMTVVHEFTDAVPTLEDVRAAGNKVIETKNVMAVKAILANFNAARIGDLPVTKYSEFITECQKATV
jgi:hypothetical protein